RRRFPCAFWPPAATAVAGAAAAATGPPACGSPRPRFLFFFFLPPPWMVAPETPALASPSWGAECHARPSAALAHLSAREKSVVTLSTSCCQFLEHLLITYPLTESSNDKCVRNMRNGTPYLG